MLTIEPNRIIIEIDDLKGFEADTAEKICTELIDLLQNALIMQDEYERPCNSSYYGIFALLKALTPTFKQLHARMDGKL